MEIALEDGDENGPNNHEMEEGGVEIGERELPRCLGEKQTMASLGSMNCLPGKTEEKKLLNNLF